MSRSPRLPKSSSRSLGSPEGGHKRNLVPEPGKLGHFLLEVLDGKLVEASPFLCQVLTAPRARVSQVTGSREPYVFYLVKVKVLGDGTTREVAVERYLTDEELEVHRTGRKGPLDRTEDRSTLLSAAEFARQVASTDESDVHHKGKRREQ